MDHTMKEKQILIDYYSTISYAMDFECNKEYSEMERQIVRLIADIDGAAELADKCAEMVAGVEKIQTVQDITLVADDCAISPSCAFNIKSTFIRANNIPHLKAFDEELLALFAQSATNADQKSACRLWAFLNWLGLFGAADRDRALRAWEVLAACGDRFAIRALAYAYGKIGNEDEHSTWSAVGKLIGTALDSFEPMVILPHGSEENTRAVELADLILAAKEKNRGDSNTVDRAMAYYILHCDLPLDEKLNMIRAAQDFYPLVREHRKYKSSRFGF